MRALTGKRRFAKGAPLGEGPQGVSDVISLRREQASPCGQVAEWLKAADCKSARASVRWFESSPVHHNLPKKPYKSRVCGRFANFAVSHLGKFQRTSFAIQGVEASLSHRNCADLARSNSGEAAFWIFCPKAVIPLTTRLRSFEFANSFYPMTTTDTRTESQIKDDAWAAMQRDDYETAFRDFSALLPSKEPDVLNALGWMCDRGEGHSKDLEQAAVYYRQSAETGSQYGLLGLGDVLSDLGRESEARSVYEEGASQRYTPAMWRLGRILIRDGRTPSERQRGISLLQEAAGESSISARRTLLGLEMKQSRSIFGKAWVGVRILRLVISGFPRYVRDPLAHEVR